jgi:hypothetical protein
VFVGGIGIGRQTRGDVACFRGGLGCRLVSRLNISSLVLLDVHVQTHQHFFQPLSILKDHLF